MIKKKFQMFDKKGISYLQILLLILSIFAFSWITYQSTPIVNAQNQNQPQYGTNFSATLTETTVSERDVSWQCCPETDSGAICQDVSPSYENCSTDLIPSKCDNVVGCQPGCCIDEEEGLCSPNTPKSSCEQEGGEWKESDKCQVEECQRGCCLLGSEAQFVTEMRCNQLSSLYGFEKPEFKANINTEIQCLALSNQQAKGACVIEGGENTCKFTSKKECLQLDGQFHKNWLCTNPELKTSCEPTEKTTCKDGKVYWVDSCGNKANIYDSSKTFDKDPSYWRKKVPINETCGSNSNNINSQSCGNCNYFLGSKCGEGEAEYGNKICKNLNCPDAPDVVDAKGNVLSRKDRRNGESWCVYDSKIGEGKDTVGSRHWKYYCHDGKVKQEPCQDYRQGICVESTVEGKAGKFSQASCRTNRWRECLKYNELAKKKGDSIDYSRVREKCEENPDCYGKNMDFGDKYQIYKCLPQYPGGFQLTAQSGKRENINQKVCSMADFKCVKIEVKEIGGWECVAGCDCDSQSYTQQMNDYCRSLGDCGGYVNIVGGQDKAYTSDAPDIDLGQYESNTQVTGDQKAKPGDISDIMKGQMFGGEYSTEKTEMTDVFWMASVPGAIGGAIAAYSATYEVAVTTTYLAGTPLEFTLSSMEPVTGGAAFGGAFFGSVGGAIAGYLVSKMFGLQGQAVTITTIGAAIAGTIGGALSEGAAAMAAASSVGGFLEGALSALLSGGIWGLAAAIVIAVVMELIGIGETKETPYYFKCHPWQAPPGGQNCDLCSSQWKECSQYRCNSLGQACKLVNKGTEKQKCTWQNPNDAASPEIKPWEEILSGNYTYKDVSDTGFKIRQKNGECLEPYKPLIFGIHTDEVSQCKFDIQDRKYENMERYFGGNNYYIKNHSMPFTMPHPEAFAEEFNVSLDTVKDELGGMEFKVKCQDPNGNANIRPYLIDICMKSGPDRTAPIMSRIQPAPNSYLKYNQSGQSVSLYTNEPANCRWSFNDMKYEEMNNSMDCQTGLQQQEAYGWACEDKLPVDKSTEYYFRCKDQPWANESDRNANQESLIYNLNPSPSPLKITNIEPNKTITAGVEPFSINLKARTSGGAEEGKATCYFRFSSDSSWIRFKDTFSTKHTQSFDYMFGGSHTINVKCEDVARNEDKSKTEFNLDLDTAYPEIVRAYSEGKVLRVITNEMSECRYGESCNFVWSNATLMDTTDNIEHKTKQENKKYYIKCKDKFGNQPDGCSIIIRSH